MENQNPTQAPQQPVPAKPINDVAAPPQANAEAVSIAPAPEPQPTNLPEENLLTEAAQIPKNDQPQEEAKDDFIAPRRSNMPVGIIIAAIFVCTVLIGLAVYAGLKPTS